MGYPLRIIGGDSQDQVPRLLRFRDEHPDVTVAFGGPFWQAIIPEPAGETVITRYDLKSLLDKLDELVPSRSEHEEPGRPDAGCR